MGSLISGLNSTALSARYEPVLDPVEKVTQRTFLGVTWAFTAASFLFLIFRLAVRFRAFRRLQADDFLVIAAWLMLLTSSIIWQLKARVMYLVYDMTAGKAEFNEQFIEVYATLMPQITTFTILYYSCIWSIKFSFLIFFRKLGAGTHVKAHTIWWWVVFSFTLAGWIVCIADFDYKCSLGHITWLLAKCPLAGPVKFQARTFYANMSSDVLTDILILSIPFLILRKAQIPVQKKVALFGVFSVTILSMVVAIIRVALVKGTQKHLQQASIDWLYFWSNVNMGVAIIIACVASFRQLFISNKTQQARNPGGEKRRAVGYRVLHDLFSRLNRLTSRNRSKENFGEQWSNDPLETKGSTSSEFQAVPMASTGAM